MTVAVSSIMVLISVSVLFFNEALLETHATKGRLQERNVVLAHGLFMLNKVPTLTEMTSNIQNGCAKLECV
jgi:hypothetical protein